MKQKLLLFFITLFLTMIASAQCDIVTPNYYEDFSVIPNECWEEADSGDAESGPMDIGSGSWGSEGFLNYGLSGAYRINLFVANKSDWLLSPEFDLSGGPFQVDFDFGIMAWNSNSTAGTLGSDDTVQLLLTNDGGITWIALLTYDKNSVVSVAGEHPVIDLTAYSGETVQFGILASEGEVDDIEDVEVFVDNFRVRHLVSCFEPIELNANHQDSSSVEVSWTEAGTATSWNLEYGVAGFTQGTGTVITDIPTNLYLLTDLIVDTNYEFYVQAICGVDDESSWSSSAQFFMGYCESIPSSNDGGGVTNVTIGTTDFLSLGDVTYENHVADVVNVFQGINNNIVIGFGHSFAYHTNIWVDFNDDLIFDSTELVYQGVSDGVNNPHALDASFLMPTTAPLGEHRMRIVSSDLEQPSPNPCYSGNWGVTLDFTVNIEQLNCTVPQASYSESLDCDADAFYIDVDISSFGDATSLMISNNIDATTLQVSNLGSYQTGPFPFGSSVKVFVTNEQDSNCRISSEFYEVLLCPPSNDECETAIVALINDGITCEVVTSGTILGASDSGLPNNSCEGIPNDDVWFSFEATSEEHAISIVNLANGTLSIDHTLYEGTCGALIEIYCSQGYSSIVSNLTIGETYFIRVYSQDNIAETTTFDLCIRETPSEFMCENTSMFCAIDGVLTIDNTTGVESFGSIGCLYNAPNPTWSAVQIGSTGLIDMQIEQRNVNDVLLDADYVVWGPFDSLGMACETIVFSDCSNCPSDSENPDFYPFGNIVNCSFSASAIENFTIDNAQAGEFYILLVTNYSGDPGTISITQTNINEEGAGGLTADFDIALGPDINVCNDEADDVILNATSPFADNYEWFYNGELLFSGIDVSSIEVNLSGVYKVIAYNDNCETLAEDEIVVSFLDCDNTGIIEVSAFYDDNENMVFDTTESNFTNGYFTYELNNDGIINTVTSSSGSFTIASLDETNSYDINYYFYSEHEDCFDVSILSFEDVSVPLGEIITVEFPIVNDQSCEDVSVHLINQETPRPGFSHTNYLIIENLGISATSGTVEYLLDEDLTINSISTGSNYLTTTNANGFSLDFVNLLPQQTIIVNVNLQTATSANLGDLVTSTATYTTSSNDIVSENNESSITEEVIGSYDPNDKMESHGKDILFDDFAASDEYLYYTIRFQNVGTAEAITVRIEDVLDTQLDESTFHMLRSSHNYVVTRTNHNLEWNFENINLPAEQDDEAGSNGYVYFKIKPNAGYAIGNIIENTAAIYFDFNAPIITNTFQTEFVETLSINGFNTNSFSLFPNPAKESVTIQLASSNFRTGSVNIYNIQGKAILKHIKFEGNSSVLDISSLESGLYFVELTLGNTSTIQKLIVN